MFKWIWVDFFNVNFNYVFFIIGLVNENRRKLLIINVFKIFCHVLSNGFFSLHPTVDCMRKCGITPLR